jgi:protein TonB
MAFEAFRAQSEAPARAGRRRFWYAASIALHAAVITAGIVYSFWHIEELSPPLLKLTFLSAAPPPPPPPPPAGGGATQRKRPTIKPRPVVQPKPDLVQPRETPKEEPKEEPKPQQQAEAGGTVGGKVGGTIGGTVGGTIGGTVGGTVGGTPGASKFLPPNMGAAQKISGADPPFPPAMRRPGAVYHVLVRIYVSAAGTVDKIVLMKGADRQLDDGVLSTVKSWRFRPYTANGMAIPFSYLATFEFKSQ